MKKIYLIFVATVFTVGFSKAQFTTSGSDIYYNSGNVGIGTTSPGGYLHLYSTAATDVLRLQFSGVGGGNWAVNPYIAGISNGGLSFVDKQNLTTPFVISSNDYVGIGTTTPAYPIDVNGNLRSSGMIISSWSTATSSGGFLHTVNTANPSGFDVGLLGGGSDANAYVFNRANAALVFGNNATETARITNAGFMGIGTASPAGLLHLYATTGSDVLRLQFSGVGGGNWAIDPYIAGISNGGLSFVDKQNATTPLVISSNDYVGIGTTAPDQMLSVAGTIHSKEVKVDLTGWPDYVFKPAYHLPSLTEIKTYISLNHHLPDIPSEAEVAKDGLNLGEIVKIQTKKIEELTLYLIEQNKEIINEKTTNQSQQKEIDELKKQLDVISKALNKN